MPSMKSIIDLATSIRDIQPYGHMRYSVAADKTEQPAHFEVDYRRLALGCA